MSKPPRHHGNLAAGRAIVAAGSLAVAAVTAPLFLTAKRSTPPLAPVEVVVSVLMIWMFAGAAGACLRLVWGRYFILVILTLGTIALFLTAVLTILAQDPVYVVFQKKLLIAAVVYLVTLLVLRSSRHVRRLTSRAWE